MNVTNNNVSKQKAKYAVIKPDREHVLVSALTQIRNALETRRHGAITALISSMHHSEVAWILDSLKHQEQRDVIALVQDNIDAALILESNHDTRLNIIDILGNARVSSILDSMHNDSIIELLECFSLEMQLKLLKNIPQAHRKKIKLALQYPAKSAGRTMHENYLVVDKDESVGKVIRKLKTLIKDSSYRMYDVFVVDKDNKIIGAVSIISLLRTNSTTSIYRLINKDFVTINVNDTRMDIANAFNNYNLDSAAVIDEEGKLVGSITIDNVKYISAEEGEDDILKMGGVLSDMHESMFDTTKTRFIWLLLNLVTAALSSIVISFFEKDISAVTALAVLMPITVSMGCNGGIQTITIMVRAIATQTLNSGNMMSFFMREIMMSLINSLLFCILCILATHLIYRRLDLSIIFGMSIMAAMLVGTVIGVITPVVLKKIHIDPAVASVVFLTTITDIAAFASLLGLARLFLNT